MLLLVQADDTLVNLFDAGDRSLHHLCLEVADLQVAIDVALTFGAAVLSRLATSPLFSDRRRMAQSASRLVSSSLASRGRLRPRVPTRRAPMCRSFAMSRSQRCAHCARRSDVHLPLHTPYLRRTLRCTLFRYAGAHPIESRARCRHHEVRAHERGTQLQPPCPRLHERRSYHVWRAQRFEDAVQLR